MIEITGLRVERGGRAVLDDIGLSARAGITGVIGPNGAGKSTLLAVLYRELRADAGRVLLDGRDVERLGRREIAREVAVVAQRGEDALPLPVRDSVALGLLAARNPLRPRTESEDRRVAEALRRTGLESLADRLTSELSGGELQRVLIARAIVQAGGHLLLDEPTNHLDIHHQYSILELVRGITATTVIVLHDLNLASRFCDRLVLLHRGRLRAVGPPEEVLRPELIGEVYRIGVGVVHHDGHRHLVFSPRG